MSAEPVPRPPEDGELFDAYSCGLGLLRLTERRELIVTPVES